MLKKLIGISLLTVVTYSYAQFPAVDKLIYKPLESLEDLSFEIVSPNINNLMSEKLLKQEYKNLRFKAYKYKSDLDLEIISKESLSSRLEFVMRNSLLNKTQILFGQSIQAYLKNLKFVEKKNNWYFYESETSLLDIKSLQIKFEKNILRLKIVREKGREEIDYRYDRTSWSGSKMVLVSINVFRTELDNQFEKMINFDYTKATKKLWLPSKVTFVTVQKFDGEAHKISERTLKEEFEFKNFKIDQKIAFKWFKSKKL